MSRARARALILVNWKGVFFERYLLDRHVTALEGANGAGKTTVMVAAYVVLLPDLTRLKFVNVGEAGATGGDRGIWGRLGQAGPSYAALELDVAGERLIAGVHLERKAAPALVLTPFIVTGLPNELSPERFLLSRDGDFEQVPELRELRRLVVEAGGQIEVFASARDYFARLFERGVTPLRLSSDEERNKFSEMLRTSMTGGISRTLTNDLRSFLFKQDGGLHDTLSRMRQSLESCRRTRLEVSEAQKLEQEIGGVHAAAQAMFVAAFRAQRAEAIETRERLERAERAHTEASERCAELQTTHREAELERTGLAHDTKKAERRLEALREHFERQHRRAGARQRLELAEAECARLRSEESRAVERREHARAVWAAARREREAAQQALGRTLAGLSSLEAGASELERKAHEYRRNQRERARALALLAEYDASRREGEPELGPARALLEALGDASGAAARQVEDIEIASRGIGQAREKLEELRAGRRRRAETASSARREQREALAALATLTRDSHVEEPLACARRELARLNELELLTASAAELLLDYQHRAALARGRAELARELDALGWPARLSSEQLALELAGLEEGLRRLEEEQRELDASCARHAVDGELGRAQLASAKALAGPYRRLAAAAERLAGRGFEVPQTAHALGELLATIEDRHRRALEHREQLAQRRNATQKLAQSFEATGPDPDADLARLAERAEGELLSTRFQELEDEAARRKEAELGPLLDAIVVDDPWRALNALATETLSRDQLWLVRPGGWPDSPSSATDLVPSGFVLVDLGYGLRLSKLPAYPTLGRAARQRRAEELRRELERCDRELEALERSVRELAAARRDVETLSDQFSTWANGDPEPEVAALEERIRAADAERAETQARARERRVEAAALAQKLHRARQLAAHSHFLDSSESELGEHAERARDTLARARSAGAELEKVREARQTLLAYLHRLEEPPPDAAELASLEADQQRLDAQQDRLVAAGEALAVLASNGAAWAWAHAEHALEAQTDLAPALQLEHERARAAVERAEAGCEAAEAECDAATLEAQRLSGELTAFAAQAERARAELAAEGAEPEWGDDEAAQVQQAARVELERAHARTRALEAQLLLDEQRLAEARARERTAAGAVTEERLRAEPAERALGELEARALEIGAPLPADDRDARGSRELWLEARAKRELLADRLAAARGYAELRAALDARGEGDFLGLWQDVQQALAARLPAGFAESGRAGAGLERLRADLIELESRLARQEGDLRGTSADVAHSIDVQTRRAAAQVKRLNAALSGTSFGSVHAIVIRLDRVAKMDQVLRALREGETQELLFQSNLPIEAALDEIFRRHAGGRSGGQRLLDYREYLELEVAIQRKPDDPWVRVNPSQVSTGEAIGIGAALMMVILAEWERDDQLLRRPQKLGSLRFLFLDEANRLSQDNLAVLFELCEKLELQLLIAAPEVALSAGNTTYRLVRRLRTDGHEEVIVSGRRASLPAASIAPSPERPAEPAAQAELFN